MQSFDIAQDDSEGEATRLQADCEGTSKQSTRGYVWPSSSSDAVVRLMAAAQVTSNAFSDLKIEELRRACRDSMLNTSGRKA